MTTITFIFNLIWAILGIVVIIYGFLAIRDSRRRGSSESHLLHFRRIEHLTKMRDIFRSYGYNEDADRLDNEIKKLLKDLKI